MQKQLMALGRAVRKRRPHFGQSVSWKAALGTCWDAASRRCLDLTPASSAAEGCLESPNCGQGSWPGVWEDVHPVRGTRLPGQNAAAPKGILPAPAASGGQQRKMRKSPFPPAASGPLALRTEPRWGPFSVYAVPSVAQRRLQLMGGHLSKWHSLYRLDRESV